MKERTEWHQVVAWDTLAEDVARRVHRGDRVFVEGRLEQRSWKDRSGHARYTTEIIAQELILLDPSADGGLTDEDDLLF